MKIKTFSYTGSFTYYPISTILPTTNLLYFLMDCKFQLNFSLEVKFIYTIMHKSLVYHLMSFDKYIHPCNPSPCQYIEHHHHSRSTKILHLPAQSVPYPILESNILLSLYIVHTSFYLD